MNDVVEQQNLEADETTSIDSEEEVDYRAKYEEAMKSIEALASKKEELLKETKQAKEEKRKQRELAEEARRQQLAISEKNGEFEKLYKFEQEERQKLQDELNNTIKQQRNEKINLASMRIAVDLAKGDAHKAELLSEFLAKSLSNVADEKGRVDEDTMESVKKQFEQDKRYAPLLGGNMSSGGSAPGNTRSAVENKKQITMSDYNQLSPMKQLEFAKAVQAGKAQII